MADCYILIIGRVGLGAAAGAFGYSKHEESTACRNLAENENSV